MKITMMVGGHTTQTYALEQGKSYLGKLEKTSLIIDDETKQVAKIDFLREDSAVTVLPRVIGG